MAWPLRRAAALLLAAALGGTCGQIAPPEFTINLDLPPDVRFVDVTQHYREGIRGFYLHLFDRVGVREVIHLIAERRGPELPELQQEVASVAKITGLPIEGVQVMQMLYELQTLMLPFENVTFPWRGPGCTGIVAVNQADGMVYHARNQDFSPASRLQGLVYTGVFSKGGTELFRAQMIGGYSMPITALRRGENGYSFEGNTRYPDHGSGDEQMLANLLTARRPLNLWTVRKVLEEVTNYEDAVSRLSSAAYTATMYHVISGVRKGVILAMNPDNVAYRMALGGGNYQCRDDYVIVTNFDFFFHDVREWFDFTGGGGIGHPRRVAAQRRLNSSDILTPGVLEATLNDRGVLAVDTIFQVLINVETGMWNATLPLCQDCADQADQASPALFV